MWCFEDDTYRVFAKPVVVSLTGSRTAIITHYSPYDSMPFKGFVIGCNSYTPITWSATGVTIDRSWFDIPVDKLPKIPVYPKVGELWLTKTYFNPVLVLYRGPLANLCLIYDVKDLRLYTHQVGIESFQTKVPLSDVTQSHREALDLVKTASSAVKTLLPTPISKGSSS